MGFTHHVPHMGAGVSGELGTQYAHNQVQLTHRDFQRQRGAGHPVDAARTCERWLAHRWHPWVDSWQANACGSSKFHLDTAGAVGTSGLGRHAVGHSCRPIQQLIDRRTTLKRICGPVHRSAAWARAKKMQVVLADARARLLQGNDIRVESMHPGWVETPVSLATCRHFARSPARCCVRSTTAPIPRWGWSRPGPFSKPGHFWHDRAQRPTAFGWQRAEDPAKVAHVLKQVPAMTGTPNEWVVWVRHRIDCRLHRAPENGERLSISCGRPPRWRGRVRRTRPSFPCGCWPLRVEPHGCVLPPAWRGGSRHRVDGGGIVQLYSWKMRVIVAV